MLEEHERHCDVLIAGGGPAGVSCAIAAARCGAEVVLCQDRPVLGGNASSEVRMHIHGANGVGRFNRGESLATEPREGGIIEEIRLDACVRNPQRSASMFDLILYEKCRAEPTLTLLLNTTVIGAVMKGNAIDAVIADRQSTEDRFRITAPLFVDCTGDGRLGAEAGASFVEGRESRVQTGESLARSEADRQRLGSTILMQARRHDRPMPFQAPSWARKFTREQLRHRLYAVAGEEQATHEYGYWWAEWGGMLDTIKDNESIRDELLAIVMGIWDHVKNGSNAGTPDGDASNWALEWFGFLPGKRESRRFVGLHTLTQNDVESSRSFEDRIAFGGWMMDLHPPAGVDAPDEPPCVQHDVPYLYDIPLRCCISRDVSNLMFAGRNISATHVAFASTRVMATCAVVGQGVGTAAAQAALDGTDPHVLVEDGEAMRAVQQRLLRDDAYLVGTRHDDPADAAIRARLSASSAQREGSAAHVVSGQTRSVHGAHGAPPSRAVPGRHRWMSDPEEGFPAWLRLDWDEPVMVAEVQLVFDTALHRHLTLSHHDGYTATMAWGMPQAETVRDYVVQGFDGDTWHDLASVTENHQRLRRHHMCPAVPVIALRLLIMATNGLDHARVCEIRVYGD